MDPKEQVLNNLSEPLPVGSPLPSPRSSWLGALLPPPELKWEDQ